MTDIFSIDSFTKTDTHTFSDILTSIDQCCYKLDYYPYLVVGNEGLLKDVFISITDTLFHIFNNFKTLFKAYRDFKRSELRYYVESHVMRTRTLFNTPFNEIQFLSIPIPRGMIGTYSTACEVTDTCLNKMNMPLHAKAALEYVKQLKKDIDNGNKKAISTNTTQSVFLFTDNEISKLFNEVNKVFTNTPTEEIKLLKVYSSINNIKEVTYKLLDMEKHLIGVSSIYYTLEDISAIVDDSVLKLQSVESKEIFSPNDLRKLAESIRIMAIMFERYGLVINDVNRLIHNQYEVLEVIRKFKNL